MPHPICGTRQAWSSVRCWKALKLPVVASQQPKILRLLSPGIAAARFVKYELWLLAKVQQKAPWGETFPGRGVSRCSKAGLTSAAREGQTRLAVRSATLWISNVCSRGCLLLLAAQDGSGLVMAAICTGIPTHTHIHVGDQ